MRIALPKGRLLGETASLVERAGWGFGDYKEGTRSYRLHSQTIRNLSGKIFQERDIPIQVAVGNYDLGICGLDWVEELLSKYPSSGLVKLKNLGYGAGAIYAMRSIALTVLNRLSHRSDLGSPRAAGEFVRIASEYPNLAESWALNRRVRRFSVFPLWGAAEAYPPENADLVLVARQPGQSLNHGLDPVASVLDFSACLIANRRSLESKNLSLVMASLGEIQSLQGANSYTAASIERPILVGSESTAWKAGESTIRLALPDGHQQQPTIELLKKAGIRVDDYPSPTGNRRPACNLEAVVIKVIRPQDMPLQVANGNFDLAITGKDWLTDHLSQFPGSPVTELLDLKFGWVRIVAVVCQDVPTNSSAELRRLYAGRETPVRIATEYVNIADKYARDNHLGLYRVIPTWGATEAFLPEDADLLIENTQTGRTLAQHNLKIIDTLFESTARLIGNRGSLASLKKAARIESIVDTLRGAVE
ncbi:MAG: ATP phosphoribosyltransferase [Chloroflexi bacterium]|nr:ATP phosphoribosyltransferase [Chloroflexota bacterium]